MDSTSPSPSAVEHKHTAPRAGSPPPQQAAPPGDARQRTVLLVDDEENILSSLKRLLRRDGYRIFAASGGTQGLEILARENIDVIISDQRMPVMTGVEFLRRARETAPDSVRIMLSGYTELESITDAINEGAIYKFLTKPWNDEQLREHIEEAFRVKEMDDENRRLSEQIRVANGELAELNEQLYALLNKQQQQLARDEASLNVAYEVLQHIPLPMIGMDDGGMIVLTNKMSEELFRAPEPLLGNYAGDMLPDPLPAICAASGQESHAVDIAGLRYRVLCRVMGERSRSRGKVLILLPCDPCPYTER